MSEVETLQARVAELEAELELELQHREDVELQERFWRVN